MNLNGVSATYAFAYGTSSAALTQSTPEFKLVATSSPVTVSAALAGLQSKTRYYFRISVTMVGGSSTSAIQSFTTN